MGVEGVVVGGGVLLVVVVGEVVVLGGFGDVVVEDGDYFFWLEGVDYGGKNVEGGGVGGYLGVFGDY